MIYVYVAVGGAVGSLARFLAQTAAANFWPTWPAGTVLVNTVGSFIIGLLFPLLARLPEVARPLVMVGFLGGLTTMSSFSLEVVTLLEERRMVAAVSYWAVGAFVCVALAALGMTVSGRLVRG